MDCEILFLHNINNVKVSIGDHLGHISWYWSSWHCCSVQQSICFSISSFNPTLVGRRLLLSSLLSRVVWYTLHSSQWVITNPQHHSYCTLLQTKMAQCCVPGQSYMISPIIPSCPYSMNSELAKQTCKCNQSICLAQIQYSVVQNVGIIIISIISIVTNTTIVSIICIIGTINNIIAIIIIIITNIIIIGTSPTCWALSVLAWEHILDRLYPNLDGTKSSFAQGKSLVKNISPILSSSTKIPPIVILHSELTKANG